MRPGLRSFPAGDYVIIYRIDGEGVVILRVLRGSRNIAALFGSEFEILKSPLPSLA